MLTKNFSQISKHDSYEYNKHFVSLIKDQVNVSKNLYLDNMSPSRFMPNFDLGERIGNNPDSESIDITLISKKIKMKSISAIKTGDTKQ